MSWQRLAEERIQEALAAGEFENLPGQGQPLDLSEYFNTPAADRLAHSVLKSAGVVPPEVELLREIGRLEARLASCSAAETRPSLARELEARRVDLALRLERRRLAARENRSLEGPGP